MEARSIRIANVLLCATALASPRAYPETPGSPHTRPASPGPVNVQDIYLTPMPASLDEISAGMRARQTVRTRGTIDSLEAGSTGYFQLRDGTARVVVIAMPEVES